MNLDVGRQYVLLLDTVILALSECALAQGEDGKIWRWLK